MDITLLRTRIIRGLMGWGKYKNVVLFWLVTGFSVYSVYTIYIAKNISLESKQGALVFSFLLLLYLCWFIYDTFVSDPDVSVIDAARFNLARNPAVWSIYCYWAIFLVLPVICSLFMG